MRGDRREMKREGGGLNAVNVVKATAFTIRAAPFNSFLALRLSSDDLAQPKAVEAVLTLVRRLETNEVAKEICSNVPRSFLIMATRTRRHGRHGSTATVLSLRTRTHRQSKVLGNVRNPIMR